MAEITIDEKRYFKKSKNPVLELVDYYYHLRGWDKFDKLQWKKLSKDLKYSYSRNSKDAKEILKFCNNDLSIAIKEVYNEYSRAKYGRFDWRLSTIIKRWTRELK